MTGSEKMRRMQIALDYGGNTHSVGDIVELLKSGQAKLFENDSGCIVAEMHRFPRYNAVHFWLLFGELKHILALEHDVLPWGIEQGATIATACGRPGWGRVSSPTGWRPAPNMSNFFKPLIRDNPDG
jgi:hypothetical protein